MECYKCGEQDPANLSIQSRYRGKVRYICRPCRREAHRNFLSRRKPVEPQPKGFDTVTWAQQAAESRRRIVANHP